MEESNVIMLVAVPFLLICIFWILIPQLPHYRQIQAKRDSYLKSDEFELETTRIRSLLPSDYKKRLTVTFIKDHRIVVNLFEISSAAIEGLTDDELRFLLAWNIATYRQAITGSLPITFMASVPLVNLIIRTIFPNMNKGLGYLMLLITTPFVFWYFARIEKLREGGVPNLVAKADEYALKCVQNTESAISAIQKAWQGSAQHNAVELNNLDMLNLRIERLKLLIESK